MAHETENSPKRIVVIGTTGSGKSFLARRIASKMGLMAVELDDLMWLPGWQQRAPEEFRAQVEAATTSARWVVAGNYLSVSDIVWESADTIVWLDLGPWTTFSRLFRRTIYRLWSQQGVCNGNIETWQKSFLSSDSILLWFFRSYWKNRQRFGAIFAESGELSAGRRFVRLDAPKAVERWLDMQQLS
eukprot:gnl/TRDRNA2_/TRDRNA2_204427_c0_seq1.p1 gnl/TRDRNA2_/TRDRNA2_204427_c0~~gnl/TRDRNA2_/TRDRNA2_204427_c0_seq1.p1  ORF type:complete len:187 (+),score=29.27 gnl/TRDRNA2_/TRDRNA2_204427_c0_seq1:56-616(+)